MKQHIFLFVYSAILITNTFSFVKKYHGYKVFHITPKNSVHLQVIDQLHDIPEVDIWSSFKMIGEPTVAMVSPGLERVFEQMLRFNNLDYRIVIANLQKTIDLEQLEQFQSRQKSPLGISFRRYNRFKEINEYLLNLTKQYPDTATLINIGETYEGRPLNVIKISTGGNGSKPAILIDGGIHAREWITPAQVLYIINQLIENQVETKDMIDDVDWYLLPVLNPDGYEYSQILDRMWRKTRSITHGSECIGTDLNRNFDFHWNEVGASSNPCDEDFAGVKSFSESETTALALFVMTIKDQVKLYLTVHSPAKAILYPWGYTSELPEDVAELDKLALKVRDAFARYTDYRIGSTTNVLYKSAGCSDDWFKGVANVQLSYVIELPGGGQSGFDLPPREILLVVKDTFRGIRVFAEYVRDKFGDKDSTQNSS